jgi:hypothetical protein
MNRNAQSDSKIKFAVFIVATIIAAIIRFSATSNILEESAHNKIWVGVSFISGFAASFICRKNFAVPALIVTAGFAVAVVLRIVFDLVFIDPTSHNLFPIELIIWSLMSFIPAIAGAFLSSMVLKLGKKDDSGNHSAKNKL